MKKLSLIMIIALMAVVYSSAQIGMRGGLNFSNLNYDDLNLGDTISISSLDGQKAGIHIGFYGQLEIRDIVLQPEILFSTARNDLSVYDIRTDTKKTVKQNFSKIDIPVMVCGKWGPFRAGAGPVATILISSKSGLKDIYTDYEEKFNNATFGYQAGIGLDISRISIDLKYEGNLSKLGSGIEIAGQERSFDARSNQFIVSVGFMFF